jgi:hypothetical protein
MNEIVLGKRASLGVCRHSYHDDLMKSPSRRKPKPSPPRSRPARSYGRDSCCTLGSAADGSSADGSAADDSRAESSGHTSLARIALGGVLLAPFLLVALVLGVLVVESRAQVGGGNLGDYYENDYADDEPAGGDEDASDEDGSGFTGGNTAGPGDPQIALLLWVLGPGDDEPLSPIDFDVQADGAEGPGDDEPLGPGDDEPLGPGDDEPLGPGDDEPLGPGDDEPLGPGDDEPLGPGDDEPLGPGDDEPLGPGDDEPLTPACGSDSDGKLRMKLLTNYSHRATVLITSGSSYVTSRPLHANGVFQTPVDAKTGLYSLPIALDLEWLESILGRNDLTSPEGGVLDLEMTLYAFPNGYLVGSQAWSSNVLGRPWLEFEDPLPSVENDAYENDGYGEDAYGAVIDAGGSERGDADLDISSGVEVVLHIPARATYFLLLGAFDSNSLDASPQNPANLSRVEILSGGTIHSDDRVTIVRTLDSPSLDRNAVPYVSLWIYNEPEGWCRSSVSLVP